ncbi:MAG: prepilin-type N-terminal cleavage/methylation domain-containing protein [Candidatus Eisenbacteria bacterium]|nr:prepilin-type N-terminal cleavage/methylation domain-containing protein [Candidatus Latescibacterota bacterium]MBD3302302.1 prepilin-type N-terminal cleavage/methylation domain-containing protein [Candidatus Eisenbacteria bacterium]
MKPQATGRRVGRQEGFTIVELAIVLVILGILAVMAIPNFLRASDRARRGSCLANQRNLMVTTVLYSADTGFLDGLVNCSVLREDGYATDDLCECPSSADGSLDDYDIRLTDGRVAWTTCLIEGDEHLLEN